MVRSLPMIMLLMLLESALAAAQTGTPGERTALAKEIEGLASGARIAYLEYILRTSGDDPEAYFLLGAAFSEEQKSDSALYCYGKAVALDPRLSKAYVNMGVILDEQKKEREAIGMFERAAEINPRDILAHSHAAYMRFDAGEHESAWAHLSEALAIDSLHPQPHFYLAIFFWESGMFRESLVEFETVVRLEPGGYLSGRAKENIRILQQGLGGPAGEDFPAPRR